MKFTITKRRVALAMLALTLISLSSVGIAPSPASADSAAISTDGTVTGAPGTTMYPFADAVITGTGTMDGITLRVSGGFNASIDQMGTGGAHTGITVSYSASNGLLRLRGTASVAAYQAALRDVTYSQSSTVEGSRTFIVVAGTAIYLPDTGNLYQYVDNGSNITWTAARAAALAAAFGPYSGHLANLSSQVENDVALVELTGNTWIGASDEAVEGEWRWMDGPEAGQLFWQGASAGSGGVPVNSRYNNWQSVEPNNAGGEDYAHMFAGGGDWNDYPNSLNVQGYLVEYEVDDIGTVASLVRLLVGVDTDGDGVSDGDETTQGTDINDPDDFLDTDGDGVPDSVETADGTDPNNANDAKDTDGDGLSDYAEGRLGTSPLTSDSDGDGASDNDEVTAGTDPTDSSEVPDVDGDGVPDHVETADGTDKNDADDFDDTDADGVPDYVETADGTDPNSATDFNDADNDGLSDYDEARRGTDPADADSDGDGVPDKTELDENSNPLDDGSFADTDSDGVPDAVETTNGTDPNDPTSFPDADNDGVSDYQIARGAIPRPRHCGFDYSTEVGTDPERQAIARLYLSLFRRTPDSAGLQYWSDLVAGGATTDQVRLWMLDSAEYSASYGSSSDSEFTATVYDNFLCRTAESAGAAYWNGFLADGQSADNRLLMINWMFASDEYLQRAQ